MKSSFTPINRSQSLNTIKHVRHLPLQTLAQKNLVSLKQPTQKYFPNRPLRILLPDFFNIPKFLDKQIYFQSSEDINQLNNAISNFKLQKGLKKKLKDLSILAEGMKRAKNIREQSRYYFIEGVILHNSGAYQKSIQMFEKFLKIVLFIKDDRSIELALNSIAIGYMYLNKPQQAIQYHIKQQQINSNDNFVCKVNIGLCYQMMKSKLQAYEIYTQLLQNLTTDKLKKIQYVNRLMQRSKPTQIENYFMTENIKPVNKQILKQSARNNQKYLLKKGPNEKSPNKSIQFENSFMKRRYENDKVNFAIFNAEQHLTGYLKDLKNSFTIQN